jgi:hypothetical protein
VNDTDLLAAEFSLRRSFFYVRKGRLQLPQKPEIAVQPESPPSQGASFNRYKSWFENLPLDGWNQVKVN